MYILLPFCSSLNTWAQSGSPLIPRKQACSCMVVTIIILFLES